MYPASGAFTLELVWVTHRSTPAICNVRQFGAQMFGPKSFNVWNVAGRRWSKLIIRMVLACGVIGMWAAAELVGQDPDRSADVGGVRGNRAELSITIKENSSQLIGPLVTVKLYRMGNLSE